MLRASAVRVDSKGRLTIPKEARDALKVRPGDTFFVRRDGGELRFAKAENPFDGLARHAETEYHAGRTKKLRDFAREHDIDVDAG